MAALRQGRQLKLRWLSRQEHSPAPPPHLTRAHNLSPYHHPCDPSTFQPPSSPPAASEYLLCPATPYLHLCKACVWTAACAKPGGSGSCWEAALNPALWMNHLQYDLSPHPPGSLEGQRLLLPDLVPTMWDTSASSSSQGGLWDVSSLDWFLSGKWGYRGQLREMHSGAVVLQHWDGAQGSEGYRTAPCPSPWVHSWRHSLGQGCWHWCCLPDAHPLWEHVGLGAHTGNSPGHSYSSQGF